MPQTTKVISFDLDDTLWPCFPTILNAEKQLYQWLQENVPEITQHYDMEQLRDKRRSLMDERAEFSHDLTALRLASFARLAEELSLGEFWIQPAFEVFYQARQRVTLFDDVKPILDKLSQRYLLASLTNGNADTVETGIDHWFDFSLNSATIGKKKSEPEIYRHVLKLADITAAEMVHIGDHPQQDILGAQSAGVFAVWLNREGQSWKMQDYQPDAEIQSLHELPAVLAQRER